jgi:3-hydroxybutyryl-CoA dehydrogenase
MGHRREEEIVDAKKVGVIGSGVIGTGVAQDFAQNGFRVVVVDISEEALARARAAVRQDVRLYALYGAEKPVEDPDEVLAAMTFTADYEMLADVDYVVENVTENWDIKKKVYEQIDVICPASTIFGVNTSCISITRVASVTKRPAHVIGVHFMNPVPLKSIVEVIRGYHTSEETIAVTAELLARMGKESIVIDDMPGFVSNRLMTFMINEAAYLVQERVGSAADIDRIIRESYGHKMGPLETADLIGVDTILYSMEVLYQSFDDSKFRPCPLLKRMVDAGLLGRKCGRGFYTYHED